MGSGIKVLIVDDNQDAADLAAEYLRFFGMEVSVAYGGTEALSIAHAFVPAVVFLDIGMPYIDGYQVATQLRADTALHGLKIIALTAWDDAEARRKSIAAGFDLHLVKPAKMADLLALANG